MHKIIFPQNIGEYLSIDEVSLSQGELYTFVTNKNGKGKRSTPIASIKGTLSKDIITVLEKLISIDQVAAINKLTNAIDSSKST